MSWLHSKNNNKKQLYKVEVGDKTVEQTFASESLYKTTFI